MKQYAIENPFVPPSRVVVEVQQQFSPEVTQAFPRDDSIRALIRYTRKPKGFKDPLNREDIKMADFLTKTTEGKDILLHDSENADRILIFSTADLLRVRFFLIFLSLNYSHICIHVYKLQCA